MSILKRQVSSSSDFSSFFSVITYNSSVSCSSCMFYFGQKDPIPILTLSSVLMKICQIPAVIFQTTSQFFFKRCIPSTKGTNQSTNFLDFLVLGSKFTKFLSFLKQKISFSSNFAPLFGIMRHISSILFLAKTLYTFSKSSLLKYKFGEISPE